VQAVGVSSEAFYFGGDAAIFGECRVGFEIGGRQESFWGGEFLFNRRLLAGDEFANEEAVLKRTFALLAASFCNAVFDGSEGVAVGDVEVREAFADRPAAGLGVPLKLFAGQAVGDRFGVTEIGVDLGNQHGDIGIERHLLIINETRSAHPRGLQYKIPMRIALAQINPTVGDLTGNVNRMARAARDAAERGAEAVVFPELSLTGYPPRDLVEKPSFLEASERELERLARETADLDLSVICGYVARSQADTGKSAKNSAAVLDRGQIVFRQSKMLLPNYDVFDEARICSRCAGSRWR
jgi:Carbon-nitrogen hydrolase